MKAYIRSLLAEVSSTWMTRRLERRATMSAPPEPESQRTRPAAVSAKPAAVRKPPVNEALHRASNM